MDRGTNPRDQGQRRALTRAISVVENNEAGKEALLNEAFRGRRDACFSIGFTGPPGAGKSTLISAVIRSYRQQGQTVGVIAVDPSSPFSGGAVLGDRVRMAEHNVDAGVFIRSLASRKALGGLSEATKDVLYLYRAFGFDVIIVESLGVGQDEIDIAKYVDVTALVLVPGYGDAIQMAKAGIMEIADVFVINKSDRPGADLLKAQLLGALHANSGSDMPPVVNTIADLGDGVDAMVSAIEQTWARRRTNGEVRHRARLRHEIQSYAASRLESQVERRLDAMVDQVWGGLLTPLEAAETIIGQLQE